MLANSTHHQVEFSTLPCDTPFDVLFADLWSPGLVPGHRGEIKGVNVMDGMTGFVVSATVTSVQAVDIAKSLYSQVFCQFGLPCLIVVDAGSKFKETFAAVAELLQIQLHLGGESENKYCC